MQELSTLASTSAEHFSILRDSPKPINKRSITLYLGVLAFHLITLWFFGVTPIAITKLALLPTLYGLCLLVNRRVPFGWTIAILFSWIGDILLLRQFGGGPFFLAGMGAFLIAQLAYCKLLLERGARFSLPSIAIIAAVAIAVECGLAFTTADVFLRVGIGLYGASLLAMMMLALSLKQEFTNPIKIGAVLFLFSDSLIALRMLVIPDYHPTLLRTIVMCTYGLAQLYLAWVIIHKVNAPDKELI